MPKPGFRNSGFHLPHVMFGGSSGSATSMQVITLPTSYQNDEICKSMYVSSLLTMIDTTADANNCYKIHAYDSVVLNAGGTISCSAQQLNGTNDTQSGGVPFKRGGSLGASGAGGTGVTGGVGGFGSPSTTDQRVYLGGNGGNGGTGGSRLGGNGGGTNYSRPLDYINTLFSPLVQSGMLWYNPSGEMYVDWTGTDKFGYVATPICGGCGGGGCGDSTGKGGGGAGGGVVYIAADRIVMNGGAIDVSGQSVTPLTGGGGGGGGVVVLVCNELVWSDGRSSIIALGGTGGDLGAQDGSPGKIIIFSGELATVFTEQVTQDTYEAAVRNYQSHEGPSGI
jgi:hypothetical protein